MLFRSQTSYTVSKGRRDGMLPTFALFAPFVVTLFPRVGMTIPANILHLLGIDHTKLTFRHNGIDRRLTDCMGTPSTR